MNWTQVETVPNKTVYVYSKDMPKGTSKVMQAGRDGARLILVAGRPLREPVARYGPFVMNTREELVTALGTAIGPEGNVLAADPSHARQVVLPFPVIDNDELAKIVHINADGDLPGYATYVVRGLYDHMRGGEGMAARIEEICGEVSEAIEAGARFIVLSDRDSGRDYAPIPSLLLIAAVHHHLIREGTRNSCGKTIGLRNGERRFETAERLPYKTNFRFVDRRNHRHQALRQIYSPRNRESYRLILVQLGIRDRRCSQIH